MAGSLAQPITMNASMSESERALAAYRAQDGAFTGLCRVAPMAKRRIRLFLSNELITEPIEWALGRKFEVSRTFGVARSP